MIQLNMYLLSTNNIPSCKVDDNDETMKIAFRGAQVHTNSFQCCLLDIKTNSCIKYERKRMSEEHLIQEMNSAQTALQKAE